MDDYNFVANTNFITYGDALFVRRCPECMRFVKPDKTIKFQWLMETPILDKPNATCSIHGRVNMDFQGFY